MSCVEFLIFLALPNQPLTLQVHMQSPRRLLTSYVYSDIHNTCIWKAVIEDKLVPEYIYTPVRAK